jgi:surface polysaccharide O-acyltransferase-like enzyme
MVHKLLYLNGLAILGVILFHTVGTGLTAMFSWGHRYLPESVPIMSQVGSLPYFELRLLEQVSIFAIPTFLFVSGVFVAITTGSRETIDWRAVLSRSRSLIIPYLIWSTVAIILLVMQGRRFGVVDFTRMYLTGSANPVFLFCTITGPVLFISSIYGETDSKELEIVPSGGWFAPVGCPEFAVSNVFGG